jgi:hypothetical protein
MRPAMGDVRVPVSDPVFRVWHAPQVASGIAREMRLRRHICDSIIFICVVSTVQTAFGWAALISRAGRAANHDVSFVLFGVNLSGVGACTFAEYQYITYLKARPKTQEQSGDDAGGRKQYNTAILASEALWLVSFISGTVPMFLADHVAGSALYGASLGLNLISLAFACFGRRYARAPASPLGDEDNCVDEVAQDFQCDDYAGTSSPP